MSSQMKIRQRRGQTQAHSQSIERAQCAANLTQAEDRLLQISDSPSVAGSSNFMAETSPETAMSSSDLTVHHLKPPSSYIAANWPLQNAALSPDGVDVAVAGRRGLALYSRRSSRWRLFGDVSHEKELAVHVSLLLTSVDTPEHAALWTLGLLIPVQDSSQYISFGPSGHLPTCMKCNAIRIYTLYVDVDTKQSNGCLSGHNAL